MKHLIAVLLLCVAAGAQAQYPNRPIKLVVPFTPGTGIDILARTWGQKLQERLKSPVVVENRPGASGNIGTEAVAKAPADGYTLLFTATTLVQSAVLFKSVPYDPRALTPIGLAAIGNLSLVANPSVPARTVAELVALAKAQPGKLNYASAGIGSTTQLAMEMLKAASGTYVLHIPYNGNGPAGTAVVAGQVDILFGSLPALLTFAKSGRVRALAVGTPKRSPSLPDVPTVAESGYPGFDASLWLAIVAPAGTPQPIIERLNKELNTLVAAADTREAFDKAGTEPLTGTPADLAAMIRDGVPKYAKIIKAAGVKPE
jgi:tripartite-type tricarboxylate transporter receptor subunit TctC